MRIDFKGKVVLVTGATRGIGKSLAENFYELGAELALTGTDRKDIDRLNSKLKDKKRVRYFHLDFLDDESTAHFLNDIKNYKKIDVCVNNAGINRVNYVYETSSRDWDDIVKVNLRGPFLLSREVGKIMKRNRRGRIVNIASIYGVITREKRAAYTSAKAALIGLTKTAAVDLAPYNVLVNSVSPGFILTDLTKSMLSAKEITDLKASIPLGRLGLPRDVSSVVLFLASGLNSYITGQNIIVDGGYVHI